MCVGIEKMVVSRKKQFVVRSNNQYIGYLHDFQTVHYVLDQDCLVHFDDPTNQQANYFENKRNTLNEDDPRLLED